RSGARRDPCHTCCFFHTRFRCHSGGRQRGFRVPPFHSRHRKRGQCCSSQRFHHAIVSTVLRADRPRNHTIVERFVKNNFDGITAASDLVSGQTASIRALYFGPPTGPTPTPSPFTAAKVRIH